MSTQQTQEPPKLVRKLQDKREAYQEKGRIYRGLWIAAGITVVVAGIAMLALPGPAVVVIPVGLAMLSLEFCWAQRLLDKALAGGLDAKDALKNASTKQKALGGTGIALGVAAVAAVGISIWA